jgi:HemY protein
VFCVALVAAFFVLYVIFRGLGVLVRLPTKIAKNRHNIRFNRSQEALIAGLFDAADGNWEQAENILIKHASNSGAPLLHYLTAARAAQSRGALDKRDEYLKKAAAESSETNMTVGLTQAELHLSEQQFDQALETLGKLHSIDPGHARVLKMMHQAYQHIGDWESLSKLLPSLQKNKVLMEAEVKLLETQTFSRLLKQAAASKDQQIITASWSNVPEHIKILPGIANIYFAAMISAGAGLSVEAAIHAQLARHWDDTSLLLYSSIEFPDAEKALHDTEKWLAVYPNESVLLSVLGKLALKAAELEKAEQYLQKSLHIDVSVDAYQFLGDVLICKGDKDQACDYFKRALELASSEVLSQAENIAF